MLVDLFQYRVALSPEQFIQKGFTERKMVLVLDLYDIVKQVRHVAKLGTRFAAKDTKWEHPCDQPVKNYAIVDHQKGLSKQMQFNMNAMLLKSNNVCKHEAYTTDPAQKPPTESDQDAGTQRACCSPDRNVRTDIYHLERS